MKTMPRRRKYLIILDEENGCGMGQSLQFHRKIRFRAFRVVARIRTIGVNDVAKLILH